MSTQLIDLNNDLKKLKEEGYDISIVDANVVIKGIPYVNEGKKILFGTLYCPLSLSGDKVLPPPDHTARFMGEYPCNQNGVKEVYVNSEQNHKLNDEIIGSYYCSSRPNSGNYTDYYSKISKYVDLLSAPAKSIDPSVSAKNFQYNNYNDDSVFKYHDTNSARAGISNLSYNLKNQKIAIVGLGGTGSFVLDFVSKTPVKLISLFDGDEMLNNNAFRIPGAMSIDELNKRPSKVNYLKEKYSVLREGIEAHDVFIDETNVSHLDGHDFVFLAIDKCDKKEVILNYLISLRIPFVDLGMGISVVENSLRGTIRKTLVTQENQKYVDKISILKELDEDVYSQNIQISELNALNAIMGIITWKKLNGYYITEDTFYNSIFIIDEEEMINEP